MPKALIVLTVLVLILGIWLVKGQMGDFSRLTEQRERIVEGQERARPKPGVELQGRLLDSQGRPQSGLAVDLGSADAEESAFVAVDRTRTDEKGRFTFQVDSPRPRCIRVLLAGGRSQTFLDLPPSVALELVLDERAALEAR